MTIVEVLAEGTTAIVEVVEVLTSAMIFNVPISLKVELYVSIIDCKSIVLSRKLKE